MHLSIYGFPQLTPDSGQNIIPLIISMRKIWSRMGTQANVTGEEWYNKLFT